MRWIILWKHPSESRWRVFQEAKTREEAERIVVREIAAGRTVRLWDGKS